MPTTTIKVTTGLRDQLSERAKRDHVSLAEEIARCVAAADELEFWREVQRTIGESPVAAQNLTVDYEGVASDGLQSEDWSDVL